jgi:ornithine--oxo-acid transaminase
MLCLQPGQHGSTYGGNPLACAVSMAAIEAMDEEQMAINADKQGKKLRKALASMPEKIIKIVRGKGLLNAIVINETPEVKAWDICLTFAANGLLAKPTHGNIIRFAPPLIINDEQMDDCIAIIEKSVLEYV